MQRGRFQTHATLKASTMCRKRLDSTHGGQQRSNTSNNSHASHPTPFPLPSWPACSHLRMPCRIARLSRYALGQHRNDDRVGGSASLSSGSIHTAVSRRFCLRGCVHSVPAGRQIVPRFRLSDADGKSSMKLMRTRSSTGACMRAARLHTRHCTASVLVKVNPFAPLSSAYLPPSTPEVPTY